ncbi:MAG: hypothetical protein KDI68_00080 [Gammaproteobacteria bacterium]|nr:hypothetical protein [Gammaproteobacteria bacterium]
MENKNTLILDLPERTPPPAGSLLQDPREVERWISGLPMANIGETSRQIFKTLVEINRVDIPNLARIKTIELFRVPIGYITHNLKKYYFDSAFPLSAKNRKIAVLSRELYSELAIAYKIVIQDMVSGDPRKLDRKILVISMQRTMSTLLHVLYQSAVVYDPFPANVWRELHRLYAYAERQQLHEITVKDSQRNNSHGSIKESYTQALLFAVLSPYRLRPREIEQCFQHIDSWSGFCRLSTPERVSSSPTLFISRLNSNAPPMHIELQDAPVDRYCRQLNTGQLVAELQDQVNDSQADEERDPVTEAENPLSAQLLDRLIQVLSTVQKRKYVRTNLNFELNIAVGLSDIHTLLKRPARSEERAATPEPKEGEIDWFQPNEKRPLVNSPSFVLDGASGFQVKSLEGADLEETIYATGIQGSTASDGVLPAWVTARENEVTEPFSCITDNESAWGYCIVWPGPNTPKIRVGEVLGIQVSANEGRGFRIGLSRWLRNIPGDSLQVGLEIIGLASSAVDLKKLADTGSVPVSTKGILIPQMPASGKRATLITPSMPFSVGDRLLLMESDRSTEVQLTRLLESTGAFSQFQFSYGSNQSPEERSKAQNTSNDFDSLWSTL